MCNVLDCIVQRGCGSSEAINIVGFEKGWADEVTIDGR